MPRRIPRLVLGLFLASACSELDGPGAGITDVTRPDGPIPIASATTGPPDAPNPVNPGFVWGINGHPTSEIAYNLESSLPIQWRLLDSLGATWYRIDVQPDDTGYVGSRISGSTGATLAEVLASAALKQKKILPVIVLNPGEVNDSVPCRVGQPVQACYDLGFRRASKFVARYGTKFTHVEAGNELDGFAGDRNQSGTEVSHYPLERLKPVAALIDGMIDGIRSVKPGMKILVNTLGRHTAYFDALATQNVSSYDIVGWHWYETADLFGLYYDQMAPRWNKDIWLGEFNQHPVPPNTRTPAIDTAQALAILADARKFYGKPRVKAAFVYQLFDYGDHFYGIFHCSGATMCQSSNIKPKIGYFNYRFAIEEQLFSHEDYVYSLFIHMNRDPHPDAAGLTYWRDRFRQTNSKASLLDAFLPERSYELFVRDQFLQLLDDGNPLAADVSNWVTQMRAGTSREQVISSLCGSTRFWILSGQTNEGFVDRLYRKLLDATPPSQDRDYWITRLETGTTRVQVADALLKSTAYFTRFVDMQWQAVLDQSANSSERSYWVQQMQSGVTQIGVIRALLYSVSFWNPAISAGYDRRH